MATFDYKVGRICLSFFRGMKVASLIGAVGSYRPAAGKNVFLSLTDPLPPTLLITEPRSAMGRNTLFKIRLYGTEQNGHKTGR